MFPTLSFRHFRDLNKNHTYEPPPGIHRFIIPRSGFGLFSEMKIYVKVKNDLGEATSSPIMLEPVGAGENLHKVKFLKPVLKPVNTI